MCRQAMQGRIPGHLPLCASTLPAGMPGKGPAASSPLECEAARAFLRSMLSKAGPGGVDVTGSRSQGPAPSAQGSARALLGPSCRLPGKLWRLAALRSAELAVISLVLVY